MPVKIHPAVIAVWAAVVAASNLIPTIPIWGGGVFTFSHILSPLSGILFGPIAGALCSATGGFIGSLIAPHTATLLGLGTFIIPAVTAFTTGCVAWGTWPPITVTARGNLVVNGGIIIYAIGTILWFTQEVGRSLIIFPLVFYGAGCAALIIGSIFAGKILSGTNTALKFPAVWFCVFGGLIGGASINNFFWQVLRQFPREIWIPLVFVAPAERAFFSLGAAVVCVPLLAGLHKIGIFAGPQVESNEQLVINDE